MTEHLMCFRQHTEVSIFATRSVKLLRVNIKANIMFNLQYCFHRLLVCILSFIFHHTYSKRIS